MSESEDQLARAVDEIFEPKRRRGVRRAADTMLGRIALGVLTIWVVAYGAHLFVHENFPWIIFVVVTLLGTTLAALMYKDGSQHLEE
jgi:hypothetical protein